MSEMKKQKVHRSKEEKLQIIEEAQKNGITVTCTKYGIYPATYYQWVESIHPSNPY